MIFKALVAAAAVQPPFIRFNFPALFSALWAKKMSAYKILHILPLPNKNKRLAEGAPFNKMKLHFEGARYQPPRQSWEDHSSRRLPDPPHQ